MVKLLAPAVAVVISVKSNVGVYVLPSPVAVPSIPVPLAAVAT